MATRVLTIDQLADTYRKAFDHVCNESDWKAEIDCMVPWEVANLYMQAIEFMTGVHPECERKVDEFGRTVGHITCLGYRRGPCGG